MDDVYIQVNIIGWSLRKLVEESVDLSLMLKVAGFDNFAIAEVHSIKAPNLRNEEVVLEDDTLNLNADEYEKKSPFCSTPRTSLLTPVPFPPIEASRISANPAKVVEWISRLENTQEAMTKLFETATGEKKTLKNFERPLEATIEETTSIILSNNEPYDDIIHDNDEQNASFHSVTSSISDESKETRNTEILEQNEYASETKGTLNLRESTKSSEKNTNCMSGVEDASRNFDTTIQFRELRKYPPFAIKQEMSAEISKRVYELLTPMHIDWPYQDLLKPLPEPESDVFNEDENVAIEVTDNEASGTEDQDAGSRLDIGINVESTYENRGLHSDKVASRANFLSEICCQFPGCETRMNWRPKFGKRRLLDHAVTHVNEAQFKCHMCSLESVTYRTMRYHYKKNHPEFKFKRFGIRSIEKSPETIASIWQQCYSRDVAVVGLMASTHESKSLKRKHRRKS